MNQNQSPKKPECAEYEFDLNVNVSVLLVHITYVGVRPHINDNKVPIKDPKQTVQQETQYWKHQKKTPGK